LLVAVVVVEMLEQAAVVVEDLENLKHHQFQVVGQLLH